MKATTWFPPSSSLPGLGPEDTTRLAVAANREVLRRVRLAPLIYVLISLGPLLFGPHRHDRGPLILALTAAVQATWLARLGYQLLTARLAERDPLRWRRWFEALTLAAALVWTIYINFCAWQWRIDTTALLQMLCSSALMAGATNALSPNLRLLRAFIFLHGAPLVLNAAFNPAPVAPAVLVLVTVQLVFYWANSKSVHDSYWDALTNQALLLQRDRANALLVAAVDNANEAIVNLDPKGRLTYTNRAFDSLAGRPQQELLGRPAADLLLPEAGRGFTTVLESAARAGAWRGELDLRRADGSGVPTEATVSVVRTPSGEASHFIAVARDVSQQRDLEKRMRVAERLAAAGTLASGVAHEINNPLTFITSDVEFLLEGVRNGELTHVDGPRRAEVAGILQEALGGCERIRNIVRGMQTLSRAQEEEESRKVDLRAVIEGVVTLAQNELRQHARLVMDLGPLPEVEGDDSRLGRVVLNLLLNAAQALDAKEGSEHEIRLSTRTDARGQAVIEVADTGAGIPADVLPRIFDPFFTTRPIGQGSGLGLWLCHGIVAAHQGEIAVESEVGRGTRFTVSLPPASLPVPIAVRPSLAKAAGRGRILVVDDEPNVGTATARALGRHHDVTAVTSARDALRRLEAGERFDVILCDLMMPDMTGMSLHERLTLAFPDQASKMVFLTGGAFTAGAQDFLDRVSNVHLNKPVPTPELLAQIQRQLRPGGGSEARS